MPITGIPTDNTNNIVTVTGLGSSYSVDGQGGTDTLVLNYGGSSNNFYYEYVGNGWYAFTDGFFTSTSFYNFEKFNVTTGSGDDQLQGAGDADIFNSGAGDDIINGIAGADTIDGGAGNDRWIADYSGTNAGINATLSATAAVTITGTGASVKNIENLTLTTGAGNDVIDTTAVTGNDNISTGAGDDTFRTAGGIDSFNGGDGNDRLVVDYSDATTAVTTWYVSNGWYAVGDKAGTQSTNFYGVESFDITGGSASDRLAGSANNDRLVGNDGNDTLDGGGGVDQIAGGAGTDTWIVDYSGLTGATVNLMTQATNTGASISGIEAINYKGSDGIDNVTANAGIYNDVFSGAGGDDLFKSGRGIDSADGGAGTDRLVMDWSGLTNPLDGISYNYVSNGWWQFTSTSGDQLNFYGFEKYDLTGGAGRDNLVGGASYDWLRGNGGDDTLNGGTGDGTIDGGAGNDRWVADLSGDGARVLFDAALSQTTAQVTGAGSSVLGIEALTLNTGVGADVISTQGYAFNDVINTGGGNDQINAGLGYDQVNGGAQAANGSDLLVIDYSSLTTDVTQSYVSNGWWRFGDDAGTAHVDYYDIERFNITSGSGNDSLVGAGLNDTLTGGDGNDTLNGVGGSDVIAGGDGTDTWIANYSGASVGLTLTLSAIGNGTLAGTGINTKLTSIENVTLNTGLGNDVLNFAASTGDAHLSTSDGDDTINVGRGHNESVDAGAGNDTLTGDGSLATSGIRIEYLSNGWYHAYAANGSYDLSFYSVEHLNFSGSNRNDRLIGFGDSDTLNGRAGNDWIEGAGGNDTLTGGAGADQFYFGDVWHNGVDTVTDFSTGDFVRLAGVGLSGAVTTGDGSSLLAGQVQIQVVGGNTIVRVGIDGTAGADFTVNLTGAYTVGDFLLSGHDITFI